MDKFHKKMKIMTFPLLLTSKKILLDSFQHQSTIFQCRYKKDTLFSITLTHWFNLYMLSDKFQIHWVGFQWMPSTIYVHSYPSAAKLGLLYDVHPIAFDETTPSINKHLASNCVVVADISISIDAIHQAYQQCWTRNVPLYFPSVRTFVNP